MLDSDHLEEVRSYWNKDNIPQIWYSKKKPLSLSWFNEISHKRYTTYYSYLKNEAEFDRHAGEDILEIGCGLGTDLKEYAKNGANVHAIDLGIDQIMLTKLNFELSKLKYHYLEQGNAESLQFPDNKFDLVYSFGVLHHTPNTEKAISEVLRVLKPDGIAIIMLYARGWKHYIKRCFIQGLLKGRYFKNNCNWQAVYNEISEVNGNSPKTGVYRRSHVKKMFNQFQDVHLSKKRMGEFFEYAPYQSFQFPKFVNNISEILNLESTFGENWLIKAKKTPKLDRKDIFDVIFNNY